MQLIASLCYKGRRYAVSFLYFVAQPGVYIVGPLRPEGVRAAKLSAAEMT